MASSAGKSSSKNCWKTWQATGSHPSEQLHLKLFFGGCYLLLVWDAKESIDGKSFVWCMLYQLDSTPWSHDYHWNSTCQCLAIIACSIAMTFKKLMLSDGLLEISVDGKSGHLKWSEILRICSMMVQVPWWFRFHDGLCSMMILHIYPSDQCDGVKSGQHRLNLFTLKIHVSKTAQESDVSIHPTVSGVPA